MGDLLSGARVLTFWESQYGPVGDFVPGKSMLAPVMDRGGFDRVTPTGPAWYGDPMIEKPPVIIRKNDYPQEGEMTGFGVYHKVKIPEFEPQVNNDVLKMMGFEKKETQENTEPMSTINGIGLNFNDNILDSNPYVRDEQISGVFELNNSYQKMPEPETMHTPYLDSLYHDNAGLIEPEPSHNWLTGEKNPRMVMMDTMKSIEKMNCEITKDIIQKQTEKFIKTINNFR